MPPSLPRPPDPPPERKTPPPVTEAIANELADLETALDRRDDPAAEMPASPPPDAPAAPGMRPREGGPPSSA